MNILKQRDGCWKVADRLALWESEGAMLSDDLLDKFSEIALKVLSEGNPELELPKEQRFASNVYGREWNNSGLIREGIAETLALLGARPEYLTTCSDTKLEATPVRVVKNLLDNATSERWASLNDVLPLLAEASPTTFLEAASSASDRKDGPFSGVFKEEDGGVTGRNYATGLLWALETLAWSPKHLVSSYRTLANLASIDPGGNYANRPINSLVAILLPWIPRTCAEKETRHNAIKCIIKEQPDVAWEVLLQLLPRHHSTSFSTHRPKWQLFIPDNWEDGVTHDQRWEDEGFYADCALELAGTNSQRLAKLLPFYFHIRTKFSNFAEKYRERLLSETVLNLSEEERLFLWTTITTRTGNHRKFATSDAWKVPEEMLQQLDDVADKLKPQEAGIRYRRLFSGQEHELYEEIGDWEGQRKLLLEKRIQALKEIKEVGGAQILKEFWRSVESPYEVGNACASDNDLIDDEAYLPSLLDSEIDSDNSFAAAYIWRRFHSESWGWINTLDRSKWSADAKADFFVVLPSVKEAWEKAEAELGAKKIKYWERVRIRPEREHLEDLDYAIAQVIDNGRADMAIQCLWLGDLWQTSYAATLALRALEALDQTKHRIDGYAVRDIFSHLQKSEEVDRGRLATMEWRFLALLDDEDARPRTLYRHLAENPEYFCETIRLVYRSQFETTQEESIEENVSEVDEQKISRIRNAYQLLDHWNSPPGLLSDGNLDEEQMLQWIESVKASCLASGHWKIASFQIGKVFFHAPKDENELWVEPACRLFDSKDNPEYRRGLEINILNSRGAYWSSGGKEEIKLAEKWDEIARHAEGKLFSRLAESLRRVSESYRSDAKRSARDDNHEFA